jgi:hypothetical protein
MSIKIIHKELIRARTKLYIIYEPIIGKKSCNICVAIITDEPAMYTYVLKNGQLKMRYDLREVKIKFQSKKKFKVEKKGDSRYKVTNKYKLKKHKKTDLDYHNSKNTVQVLKELLAKK